MKKVVEPCLYVFYLFLSFFQHISRVLDSPNFAQSLDSTDNRIGHLFLVGGFAESAIVQEAIRSEFGHSMNVIIPQVSDYMKVDLDLTAISQLIFKPEGL